MFKVDIDTLRDTFKVGYEIFQDSIKEGERAIDYYHNRQFTEDERAILEERKQPLETFNIVKAFSRLLIGYFGTVVNTVRIHPQQETDIHLASLLNDTVNYIFRSNQMETEGDKMKLDALLTGLMCSYIVPVDSGRTDEFGRPIYEIKMQHVPSSEIVLDPLSRAEDYRDARYIHRFKWVSEETLHKLFPNNKKLKELIEYWNSTESDEAEFDYQYKFSFSGHYKRFNNFLIVHTIITDDEDKTWSVYWSNYTIIEKKDITFKEVKFPYRVHKIHDSHKSEYYGIFRDILESQRAINQAVVKIQLLVNTKLIFLGQGATKDIAKFQQQVNRVNAIIQMSNIEKMKIEDMSKPVLDQYGIIDKALERIQRVLGINDSFLGVAFASDSGRKVKLQQNATILALRYVASRIEQFYRLMGRDILGYIRQYYKAHQTLRIADIVSGQKWIELNKPIIDENGVPEMEKVFDPDTNEPMIKDGQYVLAPIPQKETEINFSPMDIEIDTVIYNDEDEKTQLFQEEFMQSPLGLALSQINPSGYFKIGARLARSYKTKYSLEIAEILEQTAQMVAQGAPMPDLTGAPQGSEGSASRIKKSETKLPTNTNEGL